MLGRLDLWLLAVVKPSISIMNLCFLDSSICCAILLHRHLIQTTCRGPAPLIISQTDQDGWVSAAISAFACGHGHGPRRRSCGPNASLGHSPRVWRRPSNDNDGWVVHAGPCPKYYSAVWPRLGGSCAARPGCDGQCDHVSATRHRAPSRSSPCSPH